MLSELSRFESFGTLGFHHELLTVISKSSELKWSISDIQNHFKNRVIDGRGEFDGCIPILVAIKVLIANDEGDISIEQTFEKYVGDLNLLKTKLVKKVIDSFSNDPVFFNIFSQKHLSYDPFHSAVKIDNGAFPLRYSAFKQFLIDFGFIEPNPQPGARNYLIIGANNKKVFKRHIATKLRKRKISLEELKASLEKQSLQGEEAEKFVFEYECMRLPALKDKVDWVAVYSVGEGYDIASFENLDSEKHDRFIEVKSYSGSPYFYWSRNEINVARKRGNQYFLYLVDRNDVESNNYKPLMIRNPYENVLKKKDEWIESIESTKFTLRGEPSEACFSSSKLSSTRLKSH